MWELSTDSRRLDIALIHEFLSTSYWAAGRPRQVVERSIAHSICFGAYEDGRQIGFARVATDRAVFAYLMDVFVVPAHRGRGVGESLVRAVLAHPDLQGLKLIALRTRDAHGLYARFGFHALADPESLMVIQAGDQRVDVPDATRAGKNEDAPPDGFHLPIGPPVRWTPPPVPRREPLAGRFCTLEPVDESFAADLFTAYALDVEGRSWTYLAYGPFETEADYRVWMRETCFTSDPLFQVIVSRQRGRAVGVAAYMRIQPDAGSIEIGHVHFSPLLRQTPAATEAIYLMMRRAFELGYRRCEWKCDALNRDSRAAAQRLGFSFEGIFRQATVYKGRNRDTAWYAVIDREWPQLMRAFETWLSDGNFDEDGRQLVSLSSLTGPLLYRRG